MPTNPPHLRPPEIPVRHFLRYYAQRKQRLREPVFCFQVGANDGKINDPVHIYFRDYGWSGLLVEPLVDVFENELKATYAGNSRVTLENVALAATQGQLPFYRVAISRSRWATGLSGFRRESIQSHIDNGYIQAHAREEGVTVPDDPAAFIEVIQVATMPVDQLLAKHAVRHFDVLCVDTEGFDLEILKLMDFDRFKPEVVLFESKNLSDNDYVQAKDLLRKYGYRLYWDRGDTLATHIAFPPLERVKAAARVPWQHLKSRLRLARDRLHGAAN
ncbi:MAG TPA: FkbM family methyltransferase [Steroidobacteraceae bacterium]|jgi:FkbM family methyltransferase